MEKRQIRRLLRNVSQAYESLEGTVAAASFAFKRRSPRDWRGWKREIEDAQIYLQVALDVVKNTIAELPPTSELI